MTSLRMQGRVHDNRSNRVMANVINFTFFSLEPFLKINQVVFMIPNMVLMHGDQSHMRDHYFHDSQVNSVKAPTRPFDLCWFIFRVRDHYFHDSQVNSVNPRHPHDSPLQLCTYCTLSAILHGKNIQFWFWFFMFSIDISLWSPNNNILREKTNHFRHIFSHRLTPNMRFLAGTSCWRWLISKWENI